MSKARIIADYAGTGATTDLATQAELDTVSTVASAALPKAGGAMTGAITTNSTFDGVDIATRDAVLTSTTTTANAALPKAGGTMTGTTNLQDSHLKILTNSADAEDSNVWFQKSRHATDGSHTIVQDNDDLGSIIWDGSDGNSFESAAKIIGRIDGSPSDGSDMPGSLEFQTSGEGSASPTTRMVINSSGNVGLGVGPKSWLSSYRALQIGNSASITGRTTEDTVTFNNNAYLDSVDSSWEYIGANGSSQASQYLLDNSGKHMFRVSNASGAADAEITWTTAMTIANDGNVGIGTAAPDTSIEIFDGSPATSGSLRYSLHIKDDTALAAGNGTGILFSGRYTDTPNYTGLAGIDCYKTSGSASDSGGELVFHTRVAGGDVAERMRIDSDGRVCIGGSSKRSMIITESTTAVTSTAKKLTTAGLFYTFGGFFVIAGRDTNSTANRFVDVLTAGLNGQVNTPISSSTVRATPASRTYSISGDSLYLAMGASSYTVQVTCLDFNTGF